MDSKECLPPGRAAPGYQPTTWVAGLGVPKKDMTHTGAGWKNTSQKRQSEISFNSEHWFPHGHWVSPCSRHGQWSADIPLVLQVEDPVPSPPGTDRAGRLTRCQMTPMSKQNTEVSIESGTGKDIPQTKRRGQLRTCGLFISL